MADKLEGLGLVISSEKDGSSRAELCLYSNGQKITEVEDDLTMIEYDALYQEFKKECRKNNIIHFNWIDDEDERALEESEQAFKDPDAILPGLAISEAEKESSVENSKPDFL